MRSSVSGTPGFRLISTASDLSVTGVVLQNGMAADRGGAIYAGDNANVALVDSGATANSAASSGGGIAANCGNVTLTRSRISGNQAGKNGGGVYAANHANATTLCESTITLHHSSVTGNAASTGSGGGIYSFNGHVYGYYATLDSNSAGGLTGGGIYAYYSINLFACTVSNNSVGNSGGGVAAHGYIGLTNSTVAGNSASQSAVGADAIGIYSSTISANIGAGMYATGGVSFLSAATIVGSIIQGNTGNNLTGEVHAAGSNNIIGPDPSGGSIDYPPGSVDCDAKLGLLADNGGPTRTIALQDGSCAIDAGPLGASVPSDQRGTRFARKVGAFILSLPYGWPSLETLHFIGLSLLIGVVLLIDLRMLGVMKNVAFPALHRLLPWAILGFGINLVSGMLFFVASPEQYAHNIAFIWKLILMMLAGLNAFYFTLFDEAWVLKPGEEAPFAAKAMAVSAIVLWVGVLYFGSMLPFIGGAF